MVNVRVVLSGGFLQTMSKSFGWWTKRRRSLSLLLFIHLPPSDYRSPKRESDQNAGKRHATLRDAMRCDAM